MGISGCYTAQLIALLADLCGLKVSRPSNVNDEFLSLFCLCQWVPLSLFYASVETDYATICYLLASSLVTLLYSPFPNQIDADYNHIDY